MAKKPVAPIIAPEDDLEDIFEEDDIRYDDGTTLEERTAPGVEALND